MEPLLTVFEDPEIRLPVVWFLVAVLAATGLSALLSPHILASMTNRRGSHFDTSRLAASSRTPVALHPRALVHTRLFGVAILAAVAVLLYRLLSL
jgi:hypothetical protein